MSLSSWNMNFIESKCMQLKFFCVCRKTSSFNSISSWTLRTCTKSKKSTKQLPWTLRTKDMSGTKVESSGWHMVSVSAGPSHGLWSTWLIILYKDRHELIRSEITAEIAVRWWFSTCHPRLAALANFLDSHNAVGLKFWKTGPAISMTISTPKWFPGTVAFQSHLVI